MSAADITLLATVVVAITAVISIVLNMFLLAEQRANRSVAHLEAYPSLLGRASMVFTVRLENFGPAPARDVEFTFWMERKSEKRRAGQRTHGEPLLQVAQHRTFLPDLDSTGTQGFTLNNFADMGLWLEAEWSWIDGRRRAWLAPKRHRSRKSWDLAHFRDKIYGGWALIETSPDQALEDIASELKRMREVDEQRGTRERRADLEKDARKWVAQNKRELEAERKKAAGADSQVPDSAGDDD